jgi:alkanesulfonate monooxygenase SsuD/methylene tetrahydromethanopterin reductase-like flavin-dependent oxidoreductase (luciferase family)
MRFGVVLGNDPMTTVRETQLLERSGIDTAWFPEVPTIGYGDPFVCMALAAQKTERIQLGTQVTCAGLRLPPVLLTQVGTLGRLAPGRVRLGWGSGAFSRHLIALPAASGAEQREELRQLRELLDGRTATVNDAPIEFSPWDRPILDLDHIPLEVAAGSSRSAALAGEFGDGLMAAIDIAPESLRALRDVAVAAATQAGRWSERPLFTVDLGPLCVLDDGEALDSPRAVAIAQPRVASFFAGWMARGTDPDEVPSALRDDYERFRSWARDRYGDGRSTLDRALSGYGVGARRPETDQFVSLQAIEALTVAGPAQEIAEQLREMERIGVTDVSVTPSLNRAFLDPAELSGIVRLRELLG